jgi:hypothetical protein
MNVVARSSTETVGNRDMIEQHKEIRLSAISAWSRWVEEIVNEGRNGELWIGYLVTFMFNHVPGGFDTRVLVMEDEVERFYATLVRHVVRRARSKANRNKLPIIIAFPDFPRHRVDGSDLFDVVVNDGLHIHGIVLISIESRMKSTLDMHIRRNYRHYVRFGGMLKRIDVKILDRTPEKVADYALKSLKWRIPDTNRLIVLPKSLSELPPKEFAKKNGSVGVRQSISSSLRCRNVQANQHAGNAKANDSQSDNRVRFPIGNTKAELYEIIVTLRELEEKAFGSRHKKTDYYGYLKAVYNVYVEWKDRKKSKRKARQLAALNKIAIRKNTHPVRVLIDASSAASVRDKSRWTQALRFAVRKDIAPGDLLSFFVKNGGVAGCARKMSAGRPKATKAGKKVHKPTIGWRLKRLTPEPLLRSGLNPMLR